MDCLKLFGADAKVLASMSDAALLQHFAPYMHVIRPDPNRPKPVADSVLHKGTRSAGVGRQQSNIDLVKKLMAKHGLDIKLD
jgi:hypothetical protein